VNILKVAPTFLFRFKCFKERLEIAFAEGLAPSSANDLEEKCWAILQWFGE
jgi:hypothetical protein